MDEYVYAGKGWEPSAGECCETISIAGFWDGWAECEILPEAEWLLVNVPGDYPVHIPGVPSPGGSKNWAVRKQDLRKRRPPQDKSEFTFDELINDLNKVPA